MEEIKGEQMREDQDEKEANSDEGIDEIPYKS